MRGRLRKKLRVAEFTQMGLTVKYQPRPGLSESELESLLDRFILLAIEASDLHCGGGGGPEGRDFFVCANRRRSATDADRQHVRDWLETQPDVTDILVGRLQDAWHGRDEGLEEPPGKHAA